MAAIASQVVLTTSQPRRAVSSRAIRRIVSGTTLLTGDVAVGLAAGSTGQALAHWLGLIEHQVRLTIPAPATVIVFLCLGLYAEWGLGPVERLRLRGIGTLLYAAGCVGLAIYGQVLLLPLVVTVLTTAALVFAVGHYVEVAARRVLTRWRGWGVPVALIGEEPAVRDLALSLQVRPEYGLKPIGLIRTANAAGDVVTKSGSALPIIGNLGQAAPFAAEAEVAIVLDERAGASLRLMGLPFRHVVVLTPGQFGALSSRVCSLGGAMGFGLRRDAYRPSSRILKRAVDIALAVPLLIAAAPVILVLAAWIKLLSPGPAFFRQARVGHRGRVFDVLKLRTMHIDANSRLEEHLARNPSAREEWGRFYKLRDDPRILPGIGRLVRRTSLDELPQLVNILLGQMSLVGPRPFPEYHLAAFDEEFRTLRASVPPGLTGFWQISSRSDGDLAVQQLQDSHYIMNWSPWLDLYVILRTPVVVFAGSGAR